MTVDASPGPALAETAPAKLNLYLHVTGRRADGYHLLDSLVAFTELGDRVTAASAPDLALAVRGPFAAALAGEGDNLVLRAARALAAAFGVRPLAALELEKVLPVASGIGGGSSDAAATLRILARLWGLEAAAERLAQIAVGLGADVPACVTRTSAFMGGVGEVLTPAPRLPQAGIVLVNPNVPLPTPQVFRARSGAFSVPAPFHEPPADAAALAALLAARANDLTQAAVGLVPAIATVTAALAASPGCLLARMSGSGATCFGLYADGAAAQRAAAWIGARQAGWWVAATRLAGHAPE